MDCGKGHTIPTALRMRKQLATIFKAYKTSLYGISPPDRSLSLAKSRSVSGIGPMI